MTRAARLDAAATPARVMAVGAHPDDIEINAGGTLASWREQGCDVTLVVCTDGGAGSAERDVTAASLAARRRDEQFAAAAVLGIGEVELLGHRDGALEDDAALRSTLVGLIRRYRPDVVLTHDPHATRRFVHRDHRIAGQVTLDAIYPYARDHLHCPEQLSEDVRPHRVDRCLLWESDEPDVVVDVASAFALKCAALRAHASQLDGLLHGDSVESWLSARGRDASASAADGIVESFRRLDAPP